MGIPDREKYRGVILPDGMTPQCLDDLTRVFYEFECEGLKSTEGEIAFAKDAAVIAFTVVARHLRETEPRR